MFSLSLEGRRVAGMYLGGCNEDHSRGLLAEFPRVKERLSQMAIFLSVGEEARIAPPATAREVAGHLRGSGVQHVEVSVHRGGHRFGVHELGKVLRWLRGEASEKGAVLE